MKVLCYENISFNRYIHFMFFRAFFFDFHVVFKNVSCFKVKQQVFNFKLCN